MPAPHAPPSETTPSARYASRRDLLSHSLRLTALLVAAGVLPRVARAQAAGYNTPAFEAKALAEAYKALGGAAPAESREVTVSGPDIAENGAVVPVAMTTTLPNVKRMLLLVEKNPAVLSAVFDVNEAIEPNFSTRVKMGQSSNVYAVALTADGKALFAVKEIKVTLGGCGG